MPTLFKTSLILAALCLASAAGACQRSGGVSGQFSHSPKGQGYSGSDPEFDVDSSPSSTQVHPGVSVVSTAISGKGNTFGYARTSGTPPAAAVFQARATAEAISEDASAKTTRAQIAAQEKKLSLQMSLAKLRAKKKQAEAEQKAHAAAVHFAKANAATQRKMQAIQDEKRENQAARKAEAEAERLRNEANQILSEAEDEASRGQELISKLEREVAVHEANAEAARVKAQAIAASAGLQNLLGQGQQ